MKIFDWTFDMPSYYIIYHRNNLIEHRSDGENGTGFFGSREYKYYNNPKTLMNMIGINHSEAIHRCHKEDII